MTRADLATALDECEHLRWWIRVRGNYLLSLHKDEPPVTLSERGVIAFLATLDAIAATEAVNA